MLSSCIIFDPVIIRGSVVLASEADTFFAVQSDISGFEIVIKMCYDISDPVGGGL